MSSIGRSKHLRCNHDGCNKVRPYWSQSCKAHRAPAPVPHQTPDGDICECTGTDCAGRKP